MAASGAQPPSCVALEGRRPSSARGPDGGAAQRGAGGAHELPTAPALLSRHPLSPQPARPSKVALCPCRRHAGLRQALEEQRGRLTVVCRSFQVDIFHIFVDIVEIGLFQPAETSPTTSCVELQLMAGGRCAMACCSCTLPVGTLGPPRPVWVLRSRYVRCV